MAAEESGASPSRQYALIAAKCVVSAALLALLFSRIDVAQLWKSVRRASVPWLVVALAVYLVNVVVCTWRWHLLLRAQDIWLRKRTLLGSYLVATFFSNFLPTFTIVTSMVAGTMLLVWLGEQIQERAARAYDKYQHCGLRSARGLFATGF